MPDQVVSSLSHLMARWVSYQCQRNGGVWGPSDPDWDSPCQTGITDNGLTAWRPLPRHPPAVMDNIASALEITVRPELADFYGHWFAGAMAFSFKGIRIELIQAWNETDYLRLQENLIGHALMQRRLKLAPTFFIAATRQDTHLISLDNATGAVLFERVGDNGGAILAPSLSTFLSRLEPLPQ